MLDQNIQPKKRSIFYRMFFKTKARIIFIFIPLVLGFIGGILFIALMGSAYYTFQNEHQQEVMETARNYYVQIINYTSDIYDIRIKTSYVVSEENRLAVVSAPSRIYDINGEIIGEIAEERRTFVSLDEISDNFIKALLATEDRAFYEHPGINIKTIARAAWVNLTSLSIQQGASTLTQQVAKKLFTDEARTLKRKLYEAFCALELERIYDKNDILLMYVNLQYFGKGANGIENAARIYFGKSASELDIPESALLAGVLASPERLFSPFVNYESAKDRHYRVLIGMAQTYPEMFCTEEEKDAFYNENTPLPTMDILTQRIEEIHKTFWENHDFESTYQENRSLIRVNKAPYIVEYVQREFNRLYVDSSQKLSRGGFNIYTTIDLRQQEIAREAVQRQVDAIRREMRNQGRSQDFCEGIQASLIALEPSTGGITALIGGYEYTADNQLLRPLQSPRQPGSAFKPVVYLAALELAYNTPSFNRKGSYSPYKIIHDTPEIKIPIEEDYLMGNDMFMTYEESGGNYWHVHNYGNVYFGDIPMIKALAVSSNVAAAQLIHEIGVSRVRDILIGSLELEEGTASDRFRENQPSIALGAKEMTSYEMVRFYGMVANEGRVVRPYLIRYVEESNGNRIWDNETDRLYETENDRVVSKESAYILTYMMQSVLEPGGTGVRARNSYNLEFECAGKTGTSQRHRDLWFAGFTPELVSVIWVGHDHDESLYGGGGTLAAPIWGEFMKKTSEFIEFSPFTYDESYDLITQPVCKESGVIALSPDCCIDLDPNAVFIPGTEPSRVCDVENPPTEENLETIDIKIENLEDYEYNPEAPPRWYTRGTQASHLEILEPIPPTPPPDEQDSQDNLPDENNNEGDPLSQENTSSTQPDNLAEDSALFNEDGRLILNPEEESDGEGSPTHISPPDNETENNTQPATSIPENNDTINSQENRNQLETIDPGQSPRSRRRNSTRTNLENNNVEANP